MFPGVGTDLLDLIVHLDQATSILPEGIKEDNTYVPDNVAAIEYKEGEWQDDQMDRQKEVKTVNDNEVD